MSILGLPPINCPFNAFIKEINPIKSNQMSKRDF